MGAKFVSLFVCLFCRAKLHHNAAAVQVPIGLEGAHTGVIDVIGNRAVYFEGNLGSVGVGWRFSLSVCHSLSLFFSLFPLSFSLFLSLSLSFSLFLFSLFLSSLSLSPLSFFLLSLSLSLPPRV